MDNYQFHTLPDGRRLSFMEFGPKDGYPVFYFHGVPASCFESLLIGEELFTKHNLRIIAPNRPGVAQSDYQNNRTFSDWPSDVISIADHLKLDKFAILGNSGGATYVLACALKIPGRLTAAVVVSGAWQMNRPQAMNHLGKLNKLFWRIADKLPFLLPLILRGMRASPKTPKDHLLSSFQKIMVDADFEVIKQGDRTTIALETINEGLNNIKGAAHDTRLYVKPNGFDLDEISFPITYFHGEKDKNVPIELAKSMVPLVKNAKLITYPDEAHLSTLCNHFDEVVKALIK